MERPPCAGAAGAILLWLWTASAAVAGPVVVGGAEAPGHREYHRLLAALDELQAVADGGGWPLVPAGEALRPRDASVRVPELRARLIASGDLPEAGARPADPLYGPELEAAVRRFQARHGLSADGVVGARTLAALNVPVERRMEQIRVNLERWRQLPAELGEHHLRVNVAGFELQEVRGGRVEYSARVIVGRAYTATPTFSSEVTHLVLNPYWSVPSGIARREILPAVRKDPSYLAREGFDVLPASGPQRPLDPAAIDWGTVSAADVTFRQRPGPGNSLGRFKFVFPNPYDVYLHDTPARSLFERDLRALSHGCIRLENPLELAIRLLEGDSAWSPDRLRAAVASGRQQTVTLPHPVPIHVLYWTAWVAEDGTLHFRDDIYGRDAGGGPAGGSASAGGGSSPSPCSP